MHIKQALISPLAWLPDASSCPPPRQPSPCGRVQLQHVCRLLCTLPLVADRRGRVLGAQPPRGNSPARHCGRVQLHRAHGLTRVLLLLLLTRMLLVVDVRWVSSQWQKTAQPKPAMSAASLPVCTRASAARLPPLMQLVLLTRMLLVVDVRWVSRCWGQTALLSPLSMCIYSMHDTYSALLLTRMLLVVDVRLVSSRRGATAALLATPLRRRWSATSLKRRALMLPSSWCSSGVSASVPMSSPCQGTRRSGSGAAACVGSGMGLRAAPAAQPQVLLQRERVCIRVLSLPRPKALRLCRKSTRELRADTAAAHMTLKTLLRCYRAAGA